MTPINEYSSSPLKKANFENNKKWLVEQLQGFALKMHIPECPDIKFLKGFASSPTAGIRRNIVYWPKMLSFDYHDIPQEFLEKNFLDCKGNQEIIFAWINSQLEEIECKPLCSKSIFDQAALHSFLALLSSGSIKYDEGRRFVLGHELSHIAHSTNSRKAFNCNYLRSCLFLVCLSLLVSVILFKNYDTSVFVFLYIPIFPVLFTLGLSLCCLYYSWKSYQLNEHTHSSGSDLQTNEEIADFDAATMLESSQGGIHYFQSRLVRTRHLKDRCLELMKYPDLDRREFEEIYNQYDDEGNDLKTKTHYHLTDRIAKLVQWQEDFDRLNPQDICSEQSPLLNIHG